MVWYLSQPFHPGGQEPLGPDTLGFFTAPFWPFCCASFFHGFFRCHFWTSWLDFAFQLGSQNRPKLIQKLIKKVIKFLIDFLIILYRNLKDFRALKSLKVELSSTRELNFKNFEILVSRSIIEWFGAQLGSQNSSKTVPKPCQIASGGQVGAQEGPGGSQRPLHKCQVATWHLCKVHFKMILHRF